MQLSKLMHTFGSTIHNKLSNYMKSDKNTTQEKTKFNRYVYAGQCMYNVVKREVTEKVQTKKDKK